MPQARPRAGHAPARRRLRLGRHGDARGAAPRRARGRRHALAQPGRVGAPAPCSDAGLDDRVEIRVQDYRDVHDGPFDAISSIGMFEHVGAAQLDEYFTALLRARAPRRPAAQPRHLASGPQGSARRARFAHRSFIDRYVFPDGELHEVGTVVSRIQTRGLRSAPRRRPARALRARRLRAWVRNLEQSWDEAVADVGAGPGARVASLHGGVGSELRSRTTRRSTKCSRCSADGGVSGLPLRPQFELTV